MTQASSAKKDTQRLQRAIVDGLEDVKAQDIQVFDTEHLSPLFERVIVASGTSNRQTKALAASVRDAVRDAGFPKPRVEGEENGEWIIVDCGPAVAHIMQPAIRNYYHLEEIWGEKPVRMKFGATKPQAATPAPAAKKAAGTGSLKRSSAAKAAAAQADKLDGKAAPAKKATAKSANGKPAVVRKTTAGTRPAAAKKTATRSAPAKAPAKSTGSARTAAAKTPARKSAPRSPARKA
ncbi:ribosome silencing factor [Ramlibacter sp.]|uniref:ribosome silencing factor n=1 Tax=Ramlibacter sp. TaxID=1917967 RepID=UPI002D5B0FC5|nr:ribosome silencing factor [Ramlibacter sp.]HYD75496.1 ribosome silencing factor [Ramlibacter sp.]